MVLSVLDDVVLKRAAVFMINRRFRAGPEQPGKGNSVHLEALRELTDDVEVESVNTGRQKSWVKLGRVLSNTILIHFLIKNNGKGESFPARDEEEPKGIIRRRIILGPRGRPF